MSLYRCNCKEFNSKLNNIRKTTIKKAVFIINKSLKNKYFNKINFILIDCGGLLDEYNIIKNIKIFNNIKFINIYLIEELKNINILNAQKLFIKKIKKKLKNFKIEFKLLNSIKIIEFLNYYGKNTYNIIISIDSFPKNVLNLFDITDFNKFNKIIINLINFNYHFDYISLHSLMIYKNDLDNSLSSDSPSFDSQFLHYQSFYLNSLRYFYLVLFSGEHFYQNLYILSNSN